MIFPIHTMPHQFINTHGKPASMYKVHMHKPSAAQRHDRGGALLSANTAQHREMMEEIICIPQILAIHWY